MHDVTLLSRALAGLQAGWQWEVGYRVFGKSGVRVGGHVRYGGKVYTVHIEGRRYYCSCQDYMRREVPCKHIASWLWPSWPSTPPSAAPTASQKRFGPAFSRRVFLFWSADAR